MDSIVGWFPLFFSRFNTYVNNYIAEQHPLLLSHCSSLLKVCV